VILGANISFETAGDEKFQKSKKTQSKDGITSDIVFGVERLKIKNNNTEAPINKSY